MSLTDQESGLIRKLFKRVDELESLVSAARNQSGAPVSLPGQYPGKPIPHTEGVEIAIGANVTTQQGNITVAADGPFFVQRVMFAFRPTAGNNTGIWRPTASVDDTTGAVFTDAIDFYWEYQVSGSHRNRQNIPVPSACVWQSEKGNGAWELFVNDVIPPTATITIRISPTVAPANAGVMYVGFHGCYVLE